MKRLYIFILSLLLVNIGSYADNSISTNDLTITANSSNTMTIGTTIGNIYGIQFDVILPDGFTLDTSTTAGVTVTTTSNSILNNFTTASRASYTSDGENKYRIMAYRTTESKSSGSDLCSLTINTAAGIIGSYSGKIENIRLVNSNIIGEDVPSIGFQITAKAETIVELSETNTTNPAAANNRIHVTRSLTANQWSTFCLPFSLTAAEVTSILGSDVKVATLTSWSFKGDPKNATSVSLNFTNYDYSTSGLTGNKPYLVYPSATISDFTTTEKKTTDYSTAASSVANYQYGTTNYDASFVGVFNKGTIAEYMLYISSNKFYRTMSTNTQIKAFRGYFNIGTVAQYTNSTTNSKLNIVVDGEATGILDVTKDQIVENSNVHIYNLAGQYVGQDENSLPAGIYIKDGKKIYIK